MKTMNFNKVPIWIELLAGHAKRRVVVELHSGEDSLRAPGGGKPAHEVVFPQSILFKRPQPSMIDSV